jgi:hypothetical protein
MERRRRVFFVCCNLSGLLACTGDAGQDGGMESCTNTLLDAIRQNDLERVATARRAWVEAGCPDFRALPTKPGKSFGARLRGWREQRNYTLRELAGKAKIPYVRLFRVEQSGSELRLPEWARLKMLLGVPEEDARGMEGLLG